MRYPSVSAPAKVPGNIRLFREWPLPISRKPVCPIAPEPKKAIRLLPERSPIRTCSSRERRRYGTSVILRTSGSNTARRIFPSLSSKKITWRRKTFRIVRGKRISTFPRNRASRPISEGTNRTLRVEACRTFFIGISRLLRTALRIRQSGRKVPLWLSTKRKRIPSVRVPRSRRSRPGTTLGNFVSFGKR